MKGTTPLGFLGICIAFAVTAFLGGMAGSLLLGGDEGDADASIPVAQATAQGTPRPAGSGTPQATGSVVALAASPTLPAGPVATNTPAAAAATPTPAAATYTVVSGDTLSGIAAKQNVPVDQRTAWIQQVRTLNNFTGDTINIGQVLKLPPASSGAAGTPASGATATRPAGTTPAAGGATATATRPAGTTPAASATRTP